MISKDKIYRTRDGREVRIYATDAHPLEPVHGAFQDYSGAWNSTMWRHDGTNVYGKGETDLIEVKPRIKRTVWLNVYPDKNGDYSQLRNLADALATTDRLACVKVEIDCEEGEGL
jgi:hypothetical protein